MRAESSFHANSSYSSNRTPLRKSQSAYQADHPFAASLAGSAKTSAQLTRASSETESQGKISGNLAQKLQNALDRVVKTLKLPGAVTQITTPQGTWTGTSGYSNLETHTKMRSPDLFLGGSIAKTFTSTTVMKLVEEGQLKLDDTLGQWLPEIAAKSPDWTNITLRQLLDGSSGIEDVVPPLAQAAVNDPSSLFQSRTPADIVSSAYGKPRGGWVYPNAGNLLTGMIIEKVTGSSYAKAVHQEVIDPLRLKHTFVDSSEKISGHLVRSYLDLDQSSKLTDITPYDQQFTTLCAATGGIVSNVQDLTRFSQALFEGQLLKPESVQELLKGTQLSPELKYGVGVEITETPWGKALGKNGGTLGSGSQMSYFRDRGITAVSLFNRGSLSSDIDTTAIEDAVLKVLLKGQQQDQPGS